VFDIPGPSITVDIEGCIDLLSLSGAMATAPVSVDGSPDLLTQFLSAESPKFILTLEKATAETAVPTPTSKNKVTLLEILMKVSVLNGQYRITPESLPTVKALADWGAYDIIEQARHSPEDIESKLNDYLLSYLKHNLPLVRWSKLLIYQCLLTS